MKFFLTELLSSNVHYFHTWMRMTQQAKINKIPPSSASHEHDPSGKEHQCQHQEEIYECDHGAVFHHLVLPELQCTLD
jgi:hypothetical protein